MEGSALKNKTAKGLFWGGLNNAAQQVISVIIGLILLNKLTPSDYGLVAMLTIFTGFSLALQNGGFSVALINRKEIVHEDYNSVFWFNVLASLTIYLILFFCAPLIARFFHQPELVKISRVLFLCLIFISVSLTHTAMLTKRLMVKELAIGDISAVVISGGIAIYMAFAGCGYWALVELTVVRPFISMLVKIYYSKWNPTFKISFGPVREMFRFSFKMVLSSLVLQIKYNIFSVVLGRFETKTVVGYYSQGVKWANMGKQFITGMLSSVAQPVLVEAVDDRTRQTAMFRKFTRFVAFVVSPCMLGLAFISQELISVVNAEFLPCVPILQIYCVIALTAPLYTLYEQVIITHGKSGNYLIINVISMLVQTALALLTYRFGIYWMAFAIMCSEYLMLLLWHFICKQYINVTVINMIKDMLPYIATMALAIVATYFVGRFVASDLLRMIVKIVMVATIYLITMKLGESTIFNESIQFIKEKMKNKSFDESI